MKVMSLRLFQALIVLFGLAGPYAQAAAAGEAARSFYTHEDLATVKSFAQAVFAGCAEGVCPTMPGLLSSPSNSVDLYTVPEWTKRIGEGVPLIQSTDLIEVFESYNALNSLEKITAEPARWVGGAVKGSHLEDKQARFVRKVMVKQEGMPLQIVVYMGDLHGSVHALLRNLLVMLQRGWLKSDFSLADNVHLVFTGDFTDRGLYGIECIYTLLRLKNATPGRVYLVRGNHEDAPQTAAYGFKKEIEIKYPSQSVSLLSTCNAFFETLPSAYFLGMYDEIRRQALFVVACHGSFSPHFNAQPLLQDTSKEYALIESNSRKYNFEWSDVSGTWTDKYSKGCYEVLKHIDAHTPDTIQSISWIPNQRGCGLSIHYRDLTKCLAVYDIVMQIRGHTDDIGACKVCVDNYQFPVLWRGHPAWSHITPYMLFTQGISLSNMPSCITTTTCSDGRMLTTEGFVGMQLGSSLEDSRFFAYDASLIADPTTGLVAQWHKELEKSGTDLDSSVDTMPFANARMTTSYQLLRHMAQKSATSDEDPEIEIPGMISGGMTNKRGGFSADILEAKKSNPLDEVILSIAEAKYTGYLKPHISALLKAIMARYNTFISCHPLDDTIVSPEGDLLSPVTRSKTSYGERALQGFEAIDGTHGISKLQGPALPLDAGDAKAYVPPLPAGAGAGAADVPMSAPATGDAPERPFVRMEEVMVEVAG